MYSPAATLSLPDHMLLGFSDGRVISLRHMVVGRDGVFTRNQLTDYAVGVNFSFGRVNSILDIISHVSLILRALSQAHELFCLIIDVRPLRGMVDTEYNVINAILKLSEYEALMVETQGNTEIHIIEILQY